MSHFHYTQEKVMAARRLFARVVDLESIEDMLKNLNYTERTAFFEQQGVFGKYHPKLPTGHHSLQLNRQLDYMIACKLLFQYRKEHRDGDVLLEDDIKIPWEPSIKNVASCWKNVNQAAEFMKNRKLSSKIKLNQTILKARIFPTNELSDGRFTVLVC